MNAYPSGDLGLVWKGVVSIVVLTQNSCFCSNLNSFNRARPWSFRNHNNRGQGTWTLSAHLPGQRFNNQALHGGTSTPVFCPSLSVLSESFLLLPLVSPYPIPPLQTGTRGDYEAVVQKDFVTNVVSQREKFLQVTEG